MGPASGSPLLSRPSPRARRAQSGSPRFARSSLTAIRALRLARRATPSARHLHWGRSRIPAATVGQARRACPLSVVMRRATPPSGTSATACTRSRRRFAVERDRSARATADRPGPRVLRAVVDRSPRRLVPISTPAGARPAATTRRLMALQVSDGRATTRYRRGSDARSTGPRIRRSIASRVSKPSTDLTTATPISRSARSVTFNPLRLRAAATWATSTSSEALRDRHRRLDVRAGKCREPRSPLPLHDRQHARCSCPVLCKPRPGRSMARYFLT